MTTEDAFLQAILAKPEDDLPRLVYADWLEENGDEKRANFIRADIAVFRKQLVCERDGLKNRQRGGRPRRADGRPQYWRRGCRCKGCKWARLTFYNSREDDKFRSKEEIPGVTTGFRERGFINLIYSTVNQWCGGPCGTCSDPFAFADRADCRRCSGTGVQQATGPRLVREHPITFVHICDRFEQHTFGNVRMMAINRHESGPLFDVAFPNANAGRIEGSQEELIPILSAAAIRWAKSQPHPACRPS